VRPWTAEGLGPRMVTASVTSGNCDVGRTRRIPSSNWMESAPVFWFANRMASRSVQMPAPVVAQS
jgi:hypothetical protein